jgi:cytochrome bd ubiquinol oxidase subunit I
LGTTFMIAMMETIYVKTGNPEWKKMTKFWMTLFGINFAIGVSTGIILEFEFGTNWSNYSWFVGDIFGAPLAIEGIMAFFMESTFIAVMFFGWNKVSKKFHLLSTWLTAIGANISALWILVANGWMKSPVGTHFNPEMARNEMTSFWEVLFSPMAVNKFLHTVTSAFVLSAVFIIGVSAWFLLKKRHLVVARKSILIAAIFGFVSSIALVVTGDGSSKQVAKIQPMKFAAMEGLYEGGNGIALKVFGILSTSQADPEYEKLKNFVFKFEIPKMLSILAANDPNAYVPGVKDLIKGNPEQSILSINDKIERGKLALETLTQFKEVKKSGDLAKAASLRTLLISDDFQANNFKYLGYGHIKDVKYLIPNIALTFYSFHIMVILGLWFILVFIISYWWLIKGKLEKQRWFLWMALFTIPLAYLASELGWIVAEVGRQPWIIQDLMTTNTAVSNISTSSVQVTFILFAIIFTSLLIAEIGIMLKQIKIGPKEEGENKL